MSNFGDKMDAIVLVLESETPNAELVALNTLLGAYLYRIFNIGNATDETKIGDYSTKDMLVGAKAFTNKGKADAFFSDDELEWVTLKTPKGNKKLAVVKGGYKKFRELAGFRSDTVDLQLTGGLMGSIIVDYNSRVMGFNNAEKVKIAGYLEEHFGKKIFEPTDEEKALALEAFNDYLREKIQDLFSSW